MKKTRKMKRLFACLLVVCLMFMTMGCGSSGPSDDSDVKDDSVAQANPKIDLSEFTSKITPLDATVKLNIGTGTCVLHDFPSYLAYKTGLLEEYGIDAELTYFASGPLMVEAMVAESIDCGGYGIGGILSGTVQGVTDILWLRCSEGVLQKFFAPNDSKIVASGINPDTGFYGTKEDWEGLEVYCAPGTAMQYILGEGLKALDMTFDDIEPVYMDSPNIMTSIHTGQGDVWSLFNVYGFTSDVKEGYTDILDGEMLGTELYSGSVASKEAMKDETKKEAIYTWLECVMAVTNWLNDSEENMKIAAEYLEQWCEDEGVSTGGADMLSYLQSVKFLNLEEEYDLFTNTTDEGLSPAEDSVMGNMSFYIDQGNYKESDRELVTDGDFNPEVVEHFMEKYKK